MERMTMFKKKTDADLADWAYKKGVQHERMRIKRLIAEFELKRNNLVNPTPEQSMFNGRVHDFLMNLITEDIYHSYSTPTPAPIDKDD